METELKQLNIKRGQIKSRMTRFSNFVKNFTGDSVIEMQTRLEKIDSVYSEFDSVQSQIECLTDESAEAFEEREAFENLFYGSVSLAKQYILSYQEESKTNQSMSGNQTPFSSQNLIQNNVKLPRLTLPEFRGSYHEWVKFYDTFSALIDQNKSLSDVEKFFYLRSCLKGEAERILDSIEVSNQNYEVAWSLLKGRFENKRAIVEKHIQSLFEISPIVKESHILLRKLVTDLEINLRSLKLLGEPTDSWDSLIIFWYKSKLDHVTRKEWQEYSISLENELVPTLADFIKFLQKRCELLESISTSGRGENIKPFVKDTEKKRNDERSLSHVALQNVSCCFCKKAHRIYNCKDFQQLSVQDRLETAKKLRLCLNCLRSNHFSSDCKSGGCKSCKGHHNTLLHFERAQRPNNSSSDHVKTESMHSTNEKVANSITLINYAKDHAHESFVLLSTAIVHIENHAGELYKARVLLDSGSQSNFMTQELFEKLQLRSRAIDLPVTGISQHSINITCGTAATVRSVYNPFKVRLSFLIMPKITENIPNVSFDDSKLNIPPNLALADPSFNKEGKIDLLLGASIFFDLLCVGQIKTGLKDPILQKSKFGWIISGPVNMHSNTKVSFCNLSINDKIDKQLEKFWSVEEISDPIKFTRLDQQCEDEFVNTFKRDESGHFEVRLPVRSNLDELGDSYRKAEKRLYSLENKLTKNEELRNQYGEFMREYEELGHMSKIPENEVMSFKKVFYLPHHAVLKQESLTTKVRIVFDGSAKTTSGVSLNDVLKVGPKIQDDLFDILLRFRKHNFVLTSDIVKMYRQINVVKEQRDLQRILWRVSPEFPIGHYRLNTLTYGTAPSSFLAIRALHQVAYDHQGSNPICSDIILNDFYVDDLITGTDTIDKARVIKSNLTSMLSDAGFKLRKWVSNERSILEGSPEDELLEYYISENKDTKALGILWDASMDVLKYDIAKLYMDVKRITKRNIISTISQIFDPLGLIGPVTIRAKIMMQRLWQLKIQWDEAVPTDLHTSWCVFLNQLSTLNNITVKRHALQRDTVITQLHAFCDASESAYGACIYLRSENSLGEITVQLLCAKSRVAPLKRYTLPRLELSGALLLAVLVDKVRNCLKMKIDEVFLWTDSTIVLAWLQAEPASWKTFVANRVAQIQLLTDISSWHHVSSGDNPADVISRGIDPTQLVNLELWWRGPKWLSSNFSQSMLLTDVPLPYLGSENIPERRKVNLTFFTSQSSIDIFERFSSLFKLQRVVAYCLRFIKNAATHRSNKRIGVLSQYELKDALFVLVKIVQCQSFSAEIHDLRNSRPISQKSKLLGLNPFLDEANIIRVGGRLGNSSIAEDRKYPIVLPERHAFTKLIILNEHYRQLHAGAQAVLANIRLRFWPLNGRKGVRSVLRKCIVCFKCKPISTAYQMGLLPSSRVAQTRPFQVCGVDYAGPFNLKDGKLRNRKILKGYVCIFVCFSTKATHIELVTDLTTDTFINALKRFVSRRGLCSRIYSDNAKTFVGADNKFKQICESALQSDNKISSFLSQNSITWKHIPPRSPHFGGLWEAAVKSAKSHMKRIIGSTNLTFEELSTVLAQIEATLNSRPLSPLSGDPNDLSALSPGHFLIGDYLNSVPQENVIEQPVNRLSRFKLLQQMAQHFWRRWSREYLSSLQERGKWKRDVHENLKSGALVILKEDGLAPLHWKMGRITEVFPGPDGIVRVVNVKTVLGEVRRAVNKVCLLPIEP